MKYKIFVTIPFGYDDTLYCEYNGIEYDTLEAAIAVYDRIPTRCTYGEILNKSIEEIEDNNE